MVDNRSTGFIGVSGFNFKAGDASGMANAMSDDKMGQGGEYFAQDEPQEENQMQKNEFVDRSAQLKSSLDSLALLNAANIAYIKREYDRKKREQEEKERVQKKMSKKSLEHLVDDDEKN